VAPDGLCEREGELARVDALLAAARAGRGGVLLITGPAGIGKTVLLGAARERAGQAGMRVLAGRGGELEGDFSFGVARQLFEPLLAAARPAERKALLAGAARRALIALEGFGDFRGFGDQAGAGAPEAESEPPFAVMHGLYWLAVNASGAGPVLVTVDDLHWADQASVRFLLYLADRLAGLPVALAFSWRAAEAGDGADRLARFEQIAAGSVVSLAPLSRSGVRALLTQEFGSAPAERFTAACHAVTGGNAFLLRELIEQLRADGIGEDEQAAAQVAVLGPRSVARAVALRVARLGPAAGELARAAAVLGDGAQLRHAAALAGVDLAVAAAAADGLAGIGVFKPGTPLWFVHPIVRTAVHQDIPLASRGLRHAEAARLLAAEGADLDAVCAHLLVCEPTGSAEVVERLRAAAARAVGRGAPESAVAYLRRAMAETADVSLRAVLARELGRAEKVLGDPAAAEHLRESLRLTRDPAARAAVAPDLAELLLLAGQWEAGTAVLRKALAELADGDRPSGGPSPAVARLQAWWAGLSAYDPSLVDELDRRLGELRAAARGPDAESRKLAGLLAGVLAWRGERADEVLVLFDHALDDGRLLARVDSDPLMAAQALFSPIMLEQPGRAEGLAGQLLAQSRSRGSVIGLVIAGCMNAAVRARRGELVGAETDVRTVIDIAVEYGLAFAIPSALWYGAEALIERPELADIAPLADAGALPPDFARTASGALLREVQGRLALATGDLSTARAELRAAARIYETLHLLNPGASCWRSALALAIAAEDPAEARRLADSELRDARQAGVPRPAAIALRTRGILEGGERGLRDLREAAEMAAASGARLEHARGLVEFGAALRRANQRAAAREPLRTGLDLAYRCGATRLAQRATSELLAAGARPRRGAQTGLEALTPSERRVAELAADGMSNPEIAQALFVTLNTVEGHLRHAYQKLSISSRGQLPAALRSAAPGTADRPGGRHKTTVPP
jgi:DNA-binding CsgD family transcriptional regulator